MQSIQHIHQTRSAGLGKLTNKYHNCYVKRDQSPTILLSHQAPTNSHQRRYYPQTPSNNNCTPSKPNISAHQPNRKPSLKRGSHATQPLTTKLVVGKSPSAPTVTNRNESTAV